MKKYLGIYIFLLGGILSGFAQESTTLKLSELFSQAAIYPALEAKTATIEIADLNHKIIKREIWPDLDLQAQNTYGTYKGLSGAVFPLSGNYNVSGLQSSGIGVNMLISATAKWDVIQFGKHKDQVRIAGVDKDQAQVSYELEDLHLKKQITENFLNWNHSKKMTNWAKHEANRHAGLFKIAKAQASAGRSSAADSLLVKSQYKQAMANKKKWLAETRKAENKIKELTGISLASFQSSDSFFNLVPHREILKKKEEHPLLNQKDQDKNRLEIEQKNIDHSVLPNISILASGMFRGAGYSGENQWSDPYRLPVSNYLIGLGFTWELDGFYDKGLKNKRNQQQQYKVELEKKVLNRFLSEEENSLIYQLNQAEEEINETRESYYAAKKSYDLFKVRYESGLIDLPTLYQIEQSLQFSERSLIKAYHEYWIYWKDFAYVKNDYSTLIEIFN